MEIISSFKTINSPQIPVFEKGERPLPCCECTLWVKSNRQTQMTQDLTQTWFVQAYDFNGCGGTDALQVGGGLNPQYSSNNTWEPFSFSLATEESDIKLCAYVGSQVGSSNLPININAKITCEKAWMQYPTLTLDHSCNVVSPAPGAPQACGNGLPVTVNGKVDECGAYIPTNG